MEPDFSLDGMLIWVGWVVGTSEGSSALPSHTWPLRRGYGRKRSLLLPDRWAWSLSRFLSVTEEATLLPALSEGTSCHPQCHLQLASNHSASLPAAATGHPTWTGPSVTQGRAQPAGGALTTALGADRGQGTAS